MIGKCLDALAKMAPSVTPVVVDNASQDATAERVKPYHAARLIQNQENCGFAAAVNQGAAATGADYLLLLNPDAFLLTGLDDLVSASAQYGLASGTLVDATRVPQKGFTIRRFPTPLILWFELLGLNRLWPSNPVSRRYRYLDRDLNDEGLVDQPAGAFLMCRRDIWERLKGMDEGFYPIWFEDVDFCKRAADAGYGTWYCPAVSAEHAGAHSIRGISRGCRALYWCASLLKYAAKHFPTSAYRGLCLALLLTSVPRAVAGMILERSISPLLTGCRIAGFAGQSLVSRRRAQEGPRRVL